jgi:hypothetical protein
MMTDAHFMNLDHSAIVTNPERVLRKEPSSVRAWSGELALPT